MCEYNFNAAQNDDVDDDEEEESQVEEVSLADSLYKQGTNLIDMSYMHLATKSSNDTCGYCKSSKPNPGSATWGIGAPRLSVSDYQKMMDRGFRRCGNYVYKYDLEQSCC